MSLWKHTNTKVCLINSRCGEAFRVEAGNQVTAPLPRTLMQKKAVLFRTVMLIYIYKYLLYEHLKRGKGK
mgnify:CR=1 FL=1